MSAVPSLPLGRFMYEPNWTPLLGTYIHPLTVFATERPTDPNDYLEVVKVVSVAATDVAVTRGGGLFVRKRERHKDRAAIDDLTMILNLLLAEFIFQGLTCHPVCDFGVQTGRLIGRHASINGGWGPLGDRSWGPFVLLTSQQLDLNSAYGRTNYPNWPPNFYWMPHDPGILERIDGLLNATRLQSISQTLPTLLVAATHHAQHHNLAEGIITSWIVCEELLSYLWDEFVRQAPEVDRRQRLKDSRTYTAAVRLEVLQVSGVLGSEQCAILHQARSVRNALAHRATIGRPATEVCNQAMHILLTHIGFETEKLPRYSTQFGGSGGPVIEVEPDFDFK